MTKPDTQHFDVVIVGAGLAGATLACALAPCGMRIALLDKNPPPPAPAGDYELRVSSLNRGSENILRHINAWPLVDLDRAWTYDKVQVCQGGSDASVTFDSTDIGEPCMGHMIENANIVHALMKRAHSADNISILTGITIHSLSQTDEKAELDSDQGVISGDLLVGADGPRSIIRRLAGFDEVQGFYGQQCIVGTVEFDGDHQKTAWQQFLPTGPLGILPLAPGFCSLAWSCENEFARQRLAEDEGAFIQALETALGGHLGQIIAMPKRAAYPLTHMHPDRYIAGRVTLIGDAAHTIHPLAGLGANLGIGDAAALADTLLEACQHNDVDPGQYELLRRYERWRKPHNQVFLNAMSGFNMLFGEKLKPLGGLRSLGLSIADRISPAKQLLMKKAMGLDSDQPRLDRFF